MSELKNHTCLVTNDILPEQNAQEVVYFAKQYQTFLDLVVTRMGPVGSFTVNTTQSGAMAMFLAMHNLPMSHEIFDFWVESTGSDFNQFIFDLLEEGKTLFNDKGFYLTNLGPRSYLVRTKTHLVGHLSFTQATSEKSVMCTGDPEFAKLIFELVQSKVTLQLPMTVKRLKTTGANIGSQVKRIKGKKPITDFLGFFPCLDKSPKEIIQDFEASDANVLFIYGEPGLGKTQFIREMVREKGADASIYIADTIEVFTHPELVPFIHDMKDGSWFITEDSTQMIEKRESGNSLMAGILNATEGLSSGNVKFIISANIDNLRDVDPALIRPGRTFAAYHFKPLDKKQANRARAAIGLESLTFDNKDKLTLAEALNWETHLALEVQKSKVGF